MAIAFVNSCSGAGTQNGVTSSSMDTTGANLIVVSVAAYGYLGANLTDSESNTWTALSLDSNTYSLERIFYCISPTTSSTHTFTFNQSSTYPSISAIAFSGVSAFDSENTSTQSSSSTTIQTGSVSPPVDGCLVFAGVCSAQGAIVTAIDSGFTLETAIQHVSAVNMGSGSAYLIQSSASAVNPQITSSSSNYLAASIAVFKPAKTGLGDEKLWLCPSLDDSADDLSGNGNHGTYNGGMGTVADTSNGGTRAYSFDTSSTQRIDCPATVLSSSTSRSISVWAYVSSHDASYGEGIVSQFSGTGTNAQLLYVPSGTNKERVVVVTSTGTYATSTGGTPLVTSQWCHLCLVADNGTLSVYRDGSLLDSTSFSGNINTSSSAFCIGAYNQAVNSNHYLNGRIDDVRAFDRALTTSEITALASKRGYEVPAAGGDIPHALSSPFHPLG